MRRYIRLQMSLSGGERETLKDQRAKYCCTTLLKVERHLMFPVI